MKAIGLDDQCIDSGGAWCTTASMWDTSLGKFVLLGMVFCVIVLVWMVFSRALKGWHSFTESRKGDL